MEFDVEKNIPQVSGISKDDIELAYQFSKRMFKEFGDILKAIVLFGSQVKRKGVPDEVTNVSRVKKPGDIDILIIVDDVSMRLTAELVETYRIIVRKLVAEISERLHITSLKLSSFWAYIRAGDPVGLNILREGVALLDSGFFDPLKALLGRGMIRPSPEAVFTYFARAPHTLFNSRWHILQAVVDLYWAVIDSSHAALMTLDLLPPSPEHVAQMLNERLVKQGLLRGKYVTTVERFFRVYKGITRREIKELSGKDYDNYYREAEEFVNVMERFIKSRKV